MRVKEIALFEQPLDETPLYRLSGDYSENYIYIKREDMLPFSFGGNKARKAAKFYREIKKSGADIIMTYGSNSSNHCRIIANMAAAMGLDCHIISTDEKVESTSGEELYNTKLIRSFGATIEVCSIDQVAATIENRKKAYAAEGRKPYFITGGGHGNPGTEAYVEAYQEIRNYEVNNGKCFDYIFHASGTGTTQAGLICGLLQERALLATKKSGSKVTQPQIIGISIAREQSRGKQVVEDSIKEYLGEQQFAALFQPEDLIFTDHYRAGGYGQYTPAIADTITNVMKQEGIPMDTTYVGKAFYGMLEYCKEHQISNKRILFIHTGGTPLYFDNL